MDEDRRCERTRTIPREKLDFTRHILIYALVLAALALVTGVARGESQWERQEVDLTVDEAINAVDLSSVSGKVTIRGWDGEGAQISYVKHARSAAALGAFKITIETRGGILHIKPEYAKRGYAGEFGSVEFGVRVPRSLDRIRVATVSGAMDVQGITDAAVWELTSVSGDIDFIFSGDSLQIDTVSEAISGDLLVVGPRSDLHISTVSGRVRLRAMTDLQASVDLSSTSGSISCDFPLAVTEQRRNKLKGVIGQGTAELRVRTISGGIELEKSR